jgi:muramoyltetrapeptide carboxypeptidase LdcA involved in peptidoglycan recycling
VQTYLFYLLDSSHFVIDWFAAAKYFRYKGIIFYFEACDLNPLSFRRALIQLKNAGWFDNVKGFLVGRSYHYNEELFGVTAESSVIDILGKLNVPILINVDLGHLKPSLPIKNGAFATISYENANIKIEYEN